MKNKINFDYQYKGNKHIEKEIIAQGFKQITAKDLQAKISNTTIYGDYPNGYKFVTDIYENGTTEGKNDVGSHDFGNWTIDFENNTLHIEWENGWFETTTRAYDVRGNIEFYDIETGNWRTTFKTIEKWKKE